MSTASSPNDNHLNIPSPPRLLPPDSVYTSCYCEENIYLLAQSFAAEAVSRAARADACPWQIFVVFISNSSKTVALWNQKAREGTVVVWDYHVFLVLRPRSTPDSRGSSPHVGNLSAQSNTPPAVAGTNDLGSILPDCAWIYDFDTTLPNPCPWRDYVEGTFPYAFDGAFAERIDSRFLSLFRVISAEAYLDHFASDRSHMIVPGAVEMAVPSRAGTDGPSDDTLGTVSVDIIMNGEVEGRDGPRYSSPPPPYPPLCGAKAREMGVVNNLMDSFVVMDVASITAAEGGSHSPKKTKTCLTDTRVGPPVDSDSGAVAVGAATATAASQYGQVMNMAGFVRWVRC